MRHNTGSNGAERRYERAAEAWGSPMSRLDGCGRSWSRGWTMSANGWKIEMFEECGELKDRVHGSFDG